MKQPKKGKLFFDEQASLMNTFLPIDMNLPKSV
jgi:hypothetical protein